VKSLYLTCGKDAGGNDVVLGPKNASEEGSSNRYYADFTCSSPQAQCYAFSTVLPI